MNDLMHTLPHKIEQLCAIVKQLQEKNQSLQEEMGVLEEENKQLIEKIEMMASVVHTHTSDVKLLNEEKEHTRQTIEELIKNIDTLIACEQQS